MPLPDQLPDTPADIAVMRERGRQMSLAALQADPVQRARIEAKWGLAFCQKKWPELYATSIPHNLWQRFMDRTFGAYGRPRNTRSN